MASGILGIGITGLNAAMGAVRTTQHNIANANTPGFHRQAVQLAANAPTYTGAGFFGNGVAVATVTRIYSQFLDNELMRSEGQLARHEVYSAYAGQIDRILGDKESGLGSALSSFFGAVQEVANDPTAMAAREAMLAAGRNLAGRMNNLAASLVSQQEGINGELAAIASQANVYLRRIADLNERIAMMQAMAGNPPNDLMDQREQITAELNKLVGVTVLHGGDGSYNLYLDQGQPLLIGNQPNTLAVSTDAYDPKLKVLTLNVGGAAIPLEPGAHAGGRLAGLMSLREEVLLPALAELGRLSLALVQRFDALHQPGYGLDAVNNRRFFTPASESLRQPLAHTANTGNAVIQATLATPNGSNELTGSDYLLRYDGTNYTLTRLSDGVSATGTLASITTLAGQSQGFTLSLGSGTPVSGDSWLLRLTTDAPGTLTVALTDPRHIAAAATFAGVPGDGSNALSLAQLQTTKLLSVSTATFSAHYGQLVARTASLASESDIGHQAYTSLSRQALENQQAVSGVNLDEEAANLIRFQQAYQAAARAMQVASALLDELLAIGR